MLAGGRPEGEVFDGGVLEPGMSFPTAEWLELRRIGSGESDGGVGCGTLPSNNSERKSLENVRLASSATPC